MQFLHHFDPDACVALLRRLRGALRPGGLLAVNEFLRAADHYGPWTADQQPFQFNYVMLLSTERGRRQVHSSHRPGSGELGQQTADGPGLTQPARVRVGSVSANFSPLTSAH